MNDSEPTTTTRKTYRVFRLGNVGDVDFTRLGPIVISVLADPGVYCHTGPRNEMGQFWEDPEVQVRELWESSPLRALMGSMTCGTEEAAQARMVVVAAASEETFTARDVLIVGPVRILLDRDLQPMATTMDARLTGITGTWPQDTADWQRVLSCCPPDVPAFCVSVCHADRVETVDALHEALAVLRARGQGPELVFLCVPSGHETQVLYQRCVDLLYDAAHRHDQEDLAEGGCLLMVCRDVSALHLAHHLAHEDVPTVLWHTKGACEDPGLWSQTTAPPWWGPDGVYDAIEALSSTFPLQHMGPNSPWQRPV